MKLLKMYSRSVFIARAYAHNEAYLSGVEAVGEYYL